jgi:hypothetical protein
MFEKLKSIIYPNITKVKYGFFILIVAILTLLPILNILKMINFGDNNLSNDYVVGINFITNALDGQLNLKDFIFSSWSPRNHFTPIPSAITIVLAYFTHWNTYAEMYLGFILMIFRLGLLWDIFTQNRKWGQRLLVLPILAALVFSPIQSTTFTWGGISLAFGLLMFFGTLGIWGLVRFQRRFLGIGIMAISGIIASWTWGAGIVVWPLYLIGLILLNYRKIAYYITWLGSAGIAAFPYLYYTFIDSGSSGGIISLFNFKAALKLLGAALAQNGFKEQEGYLLGAVGVAGICIFIILMYLWLKRFHTTLLNQSTPPILLIFWGILGAWLISFARSDMAPWYASISINFWIGLSGLIFILIFDYLDLSNDKSLHRLKSIFFILPVSALIIISAIYLSYNVFSLQYPFYLPSRAPSSAACLRNYQTAPTYCERLLFQWGSRDVNLIQLLAEPLAKRRLSVFAPHQIWTLQGDYVLNDVQIYSPSFSQVSWWTDLDGERSQWYDYRHLDLLLPSPATISWPIDLTKNINHAELKTAIGINTHYAESKNGENVTFKIIIKPESQKEKILYEKNISSDVHGWQDIQIKLNDYIGKKITIQLSTEGGENEMGAWAMYKFPIIDIRENQQPLLFDENNQYQPQNTDLFKEFPTTSINDLVFDGLDKNMWEGVNIHQSSNDPNTWLPENDSLFKLRSPISLCMSNYSEIIVQIADPENTTGYIIVYLTSNNGLHTINMPILRDGKMHSYSYPLRLLELDPNSSLLDISVKPISSSEGRIQFGGVILIRSEDSNNDCGK